LDQLVSLSININIMLIGEKNSFVECRMGYLELAVDFGVNNNYFCL
jgi:hypothetical protein